MARYLTAAETAKLVRKALKAEFPGQKFSVRSSTYAGGASIRVSWVDGPTAKAVKAVAGVFAGATFDGMVDLKSYHTSLLDGEEVRFGADFVFCEREHTVARVEAAIAQVCETYAGVEVDEFRIYEREDGTASQSHLTNHDWQRRVYEALDVPA